MYEVQVNVPHLTEGATIEIDGLGIFTQGETTQVEDDAVESFRRKHTETGKPMRKLVSLLKGTGITIVSIGDQPPLVLEEEEADPGDISEDSTQKEGE